MIKASSGESEVPTALSNQRAATLNERFLKGPIPFRHIGTAAKLPGQTLPVYLAIHHQTALTRRDWVTLPKSLMEQLGIGRDAKGRALHQLEVAGLIRVAREKGRSARVSLASTNTAVVDQVVAQGEYIWQNADWVITSVGLASRTQEYLIPASQLVEVRPVKGNDRVAMWPLQMAEKTWVNVPAFVEAFQQALSVHKPSGWDTLDVNESVKLAHIRFAQRSQASRNNQAPDFT